MHDWQDNLICSGKKSLHLVRKPWKVKAAQSHNRDMQLVMHSKDEHYPTLWTNKVHSYISKPLHYFPMTNDITPTIEYHKDTCSHNFVPTIYFSYWAFMLVQSMPKHIAPWLYTVPMTFRFQ